MYNAEGERQLWELYLSNPFSDQNFHEFKTGIKRKSMTKEEIEREATKGMNEALGMLGGVNLGG